MCDPTSPTGCTQVTLEQYEDMWGYPPGSCAANPQCPWVPENCSGVSALAAQCSRDFFYRCVQRENNRDSSWCRPYPDTYYNRSNPDLIFYTQYETEYQCKACDNCLCNDKSPPRNTVKPKSGPETGPKNCTFIDTLEGDTRSGCSECQFCADPSNPTERLIDAVGWCYDCSKDLYGNEWGTSPVVSYALQRYDQCSEACSGRLKKYCVYDIAVTYIFSEYGIWGPSSENSTVKCLTDSEIAHLDNIDKWMVPNNSCDTIQRMSKVGGLATRQRPAPRSPPTC